MDLIKSLTFLSHLMYSNFSTHQIFVKFMDIIQSLLFDRWQCIYIPL